MSEKDFQLLMDLFEGELKETFTKEEALQTFVDAGILDKDGKYTEPYKDLTLIWPR